MLITYKHKESEMTKKDYIAIANIISNTRNAYNSTEVSEAFDTLVNELIAYMQDDNDRFNRDKFYVASR
jgi:hypothetical protein